VFAAAGHARTRVPLPAGLSAPPPSLHHRGRTALGSSQVWRSRCPVVGDSAYADGETRERLGNAGYNVRAKVPSARNREGRFTKDRFHINLDDNTVTCPADHTVAITWSRRGGGKASFKPHCRTCCPQSDRCTAARRGRSISIHRHEAVLQHARSEQHTTDWIQRYRADRPIVERKLAHFTRRLWGGRHARFAASPASPPTSTPEPQHSTWPAWPSSASASTAPPGRPPPLDLHPSRLTGGMPRTPKRSPYDHTGDQSEPNRPKPTEPPALAPTMGLLQQPPSGSRNIAPDLPVARRWPGPLRSGQSGRVPISESIDYRDARADDADEIAALWAVANRARGAHVDDVAVDMVRRRIAATDAVGKIAEQDDRIVGVAILSPAREDGGRGKPIPGLAHLNTVAVTPDRWGVGVARTILGLIVEHAREMNYIELQLYVDEDNERARRLYEFDGWKATGEVVRAEHIALLRYVRLL